MKFTYNTRINLLMAFAGLALSYMRHGIETKWTKFETWGDVAASWLIHIIAVWVLMFLSWFCIMQWHKVFTGEALTENTPSSKFTHYFAMTAIVACAAIWFLIRVPIGSSNAPDW